MRLIYNIVMMIGLIVFAPIIFVKVLLTPKYRGRIGERLGFGIDQAARTLGGSPRIWLHALSVGEVASARTIVRELKKHLPAASIIFSTTTSSGARYAKETLAGEVDLFVSFPLDLIFSVKKVVSHLAPDVFVMVETDFWPNFMAEIKRQKISAMLINGRISEKSFATYRRFSFFFQPMFRSLDLLAMQTETDAKRMRHLGVASRKVEVLGNLKYDTAIPATSSQTMPERKDFGFEADKKIWIAGSTHDGEESIILAVYREVVKRFPDLRLIIAPRNIERASNVAEAVQASGFTINMRSSNSAQDSQVLVLDTLGELALLYGISDTAFVGGSLVPEGGHNPLEPAVWGVPVFFGPHMEDFEEISRDLIAAGGAQIVDSQEQMVALLSRLLDDAKSKEQLGQMAKDFVKQQQGITARHIAAIDHMLGLEGDDAKGS